MYKEVFRFPSWVRATGCCFKCNVKPGGIRDFGSQAAWRLPENRLQHWDILTRILQEGGDISPLFATPGLTTGQFAIDWLHCCDLGVCADFLGNLFWMLLPLVSAGGNKAAQASALFVEMQTYYQEECVESRLDNLTLTMLRKTPTSSPKLRAKAAEARCLVRFARLMSHKYLSADIPVQATARQASEHLENCYRQLSAHEFSPSVLQQECTKFCLLYGALEEQYDGSLWKVKPKFHLWQELCMSGSNPSDHWVYRDEDFGGSIASVGRRRGGSNTAESTGAAVLQKFRGKHEPFLK